jgi:hypothetical protein
VWNFPRTHGNVNQNHGVCLQAVNVVAAAMLFRTKVMSAASRSRRSNAAERIF